MRKLNKPTMKRHVSVLCLCGVYLDIPECLPPCQAVSVFGWVFGHGVCVCVCVCVCRSLCEQIRMCLGLGLNLAGSPQPDLGSRRRQPVLRSASGWSERRREERRAAGSPEPLALTALFV